MAAKNFLDDYVDVATRIAQFYERYPDGRLTRDGEPRLMAVGDQQFILYRALAFRTVDDPLPAPGTAWEPIPGATQFTRLSEVMNAETSAVGRAIVNVGIPSKKIASREEVQARSGAPAVDTTADKPSDAQLKFLRSLVTKHNPSRKSVRIMLERVGAGHLAGEAKWTPELTRQQCSALIEIFKEGVLPTGESDIPSDLPDTPQDGPPEFASDVPWDELPSKDEAQQILDEARGA